MHEGDRNVVLKVNVSNLNDIFLHTQATEHGVGDLSDADEVLIKMKEDGILDLDKGKVTSEATRISPQDNFFPDD